MNRQLSQNSNKKHALVLDLGTTGIKAFVFDDNLNVVGKAYRPLQKSFPKKGWVEQNPQLLLSISRAILKQVIKHCDLPVKSFIGFGITNQRETTILWNKVTGQPVYPAVVWEDKRTTRECSKWQNKFGELVHQKTGLTINSYFSASKIWWILKHSKTAQRLLKQNRLAFGTVDSWILWNFLQGHPHLTDYTNASRTLLFNIKTLKWDRDLLRIFGVSPRLLPCTKPSYGKFGKSQKDLLGFSLPVLAVCGDQQASLRATGTKTGTTKATFGTGSFLLQIIGSRFASHNEFFTTLTANETQPSYALEAKIEFYGKNIEEALSSPNKLDQALKKLAKMTDQKIKRLPSKPKNLVIDGGVTRDGKLAPILSNISHLPVHEQKIFDGTALGIAKLMFRK